MNNKSLPIYYIIDAKRGKSYQERKLELNKDSLKYIDISNNI